MSAHTINRKDTSFSFRTKETIIEILKKQAIEANRIVLCVATEQYHNQFYLSTIVLKLCMPVQF